MHRTGAARILSSTLASIAVLVLASDATAQETSDVVSSVAVNIALDSANVDADARQYIINLADCRDLVQARDDIRFTWTFTRTPPSDGVYSVKVRAQGETCDETTLTRATDDECELVVDQRSLPSGQTLTFNLTWDEVTRLQTTDDCDGRSGDFNDVVLIFSNFDTTSEDETDFDEVRFQFETERPSAPSGVEVQAGESSLAVDWNEVSGSDSYRVYYSREVLTAGMSPDDVVANFDDTTSTSLTVTDNLIVNTVYYVAVSSIDDYLNVSLLSDVVEVSTQPVTDFWELYKQEGGREPGCAVVSAGRSGSAGPALFLVAFGIGAIRRRRVGGFNRSERPEGR